VTHSGDLAADLESDMEHPRRLAVALAIATELLVAAPLPVFRKWPGPKAESLFER